MATAPTAGPNAPMTPMSIRYVGFFMAATSGNSQIIHEQAKAAIKNAVIGRFWIWSEQDARILIPDEQCTPVHLSFFKCPCRVHRCHVFHRQKLYGEKKSFFLSDFKKRFQTAFFSNKKNYFLPAIAIASPSVSTTSAIPGEARCVGADGAAFTGFACSSSHFVA